MHLYLNYNHYVIELLNPTLESLGIITDQLECLKSKYRDFFRDLDRLFRH